MRTKLKSTVAASSAPSSRSKTLFARLTSDKRGNVMMIFGFAVIPLTLAAGMGIDYARAERLQTRMNAAADAAVLTAVSQTNIPKTNDQAKDAAIAMFNAQVSGLSGMIYEPANLSVTVNQVTTGAITSRTALVSYTAKSINIFSGILNAATLPVRGTSASNATVAPNIDFYVLLDSSPSMALPTTSTGLTNMRTLTGCAFACHLSDPHSEGINIKDNATFAINKPMSVFDSTRNVTVIDAAGDYVDASKDVHNPDGTFVDSYWLALNKGWPVRIDSARSAVNDLMSVAKDTAVTNHTIYRAALSTFDYGPNYKNLSGITADLDSVGAKTSQIQLWKMYRNSQHTPTLNTNDQETDFQTAFTNMTASVPNPGNGTNTVGDTPQAILFLVTDGLSDENLGGRTHRELQAAHIAQCNAFKARGIRIAILYTEYLPESLTGNPWSQSNVAPYLPNVAPALQSCASPGLFYTVTKDQDISTALTALFRQAISTPHLLQ